MSELLSQKALFLTGEGDAWYARNKTALTQKVPVLDPILKALEEMAIVPRNVLEIGCSNGWRLQKLQALTGAACSGIDPSSQAIAEGLAKAPKLDLVVGTADCLPFGHAQFDMVIFGFCLYVCDREDLARIVAESDRVLANGGYIVIYDFYSDAAYRNPYHHRPGYYSYKMNYGSLFTSNPSYKEILKRLIPVERNADATTAVIILHKSQG